MPYNRIKRRFIFSNLFSSSLASPSSLLLSLNLWCQVSPTLGIVSFTLVAAWREREKEEKRLGRLKKRKDQRVARAFNLFPRLCFVEPGCEQASKIRRAD
ncbi:hypothetical protein L6452_17623 [Arctium lappa]|uniref:Uncharacterized protein n=1 Tax=Arctium lappa TaxID=4217 RepID=A0ACB9C3Z4_ARCLA|nr:hypothetical protein L6452_17623 [Arctium lappa]